jgi:hypothetical protein
VKVLTGKIGIEVLPGEPRPGEHAIYFKLRHKKLPAGEIMFAMPPGHAQAFEQMIVTVLEGGGQAESGTTVRGVEP